MLGQFELQRGCVDAASTDASRNIELALNVFENPVLPNSPTPVRELLSSDPGTCSPRFFAIVKGRLVGSGMGDADQDFHKDLVFVFHREVSFPCAHCICRLNPLCRSVGVPVARVCVASWSGLCVAEGRVSILSCTQTRLSQLRPRPRTRTRPSHYNTIQPNTTTG